MSSSTVNRFVKVAVLAVAKDRTAWLKVLLNACPELSNWRDPDGRTLHMLAAYTGSPKALLMLLAWCVVGGRRTISIHDSDNDGFTLLDWAILGGNKTVLDILVTVPKPKQP